MERREHGRAPIELRVEYRKRNGFFADYTRNISKGGTFIKTDRAVPLGTRFLFQLVVPGRPHPFERAGQVVHVGGSGDEAGIGIRFSWEDPARRREFEEAVEAMMTESLGPQVAARILHRR
jgi:type IV pilus assembly protein PilZ